MNETCVKFKVSSVNADVAAIKKKIYECANVLQVGGCKLFFFSAASFKNICSTSFIVALW